MFNRQKIAAIALAAVALGFAGVATAGTASANKADDKFIAILEQAGLKIADPAEAREFGQAVCSALDDGHKPGELEKELIKENGLDKDQAETVIAAAVVSYCPEHGDLFPA